MQSTPYYILKVCQSYAPYIIHTSVYLGEELFECMQGGIPRATQYKPNDRPIRSVSTVHLAMQNHSLPPILYKHTLIA